MTKMGYKILWVALMSVMPFMVSANSPQIKKFDGYNLVVQQDGPVLGYSPQSGVRILEKDGFAFKDLNRNNRLDPYEDWRLPAIDRARDLASRLTIEEIRLDAL